MTTEMIYRQTITTVLSKGLLKKKILNDCAILGNINFMSTGCPLGKVAIACREATL